MKRYKLPFKLMDKKGILLFEVLLSILVLSIGITTTLQAFQHIISVTKRSRDYFEARLITSDIMFNLFAMPELAEEEIITGRKEEFKNDNITLSDKYYVMCEAEDILPLNKDEDEELLLDEESIMSFKKVSTEIYKKDDMVINFNSFHVMKKNDEY